MSDNIQELFGQSIIDAVAEFAKNDITDVAALRAQKFHHVRDAALRQTLAQTLYGTRWLYKLGVALLVKGPERYAHVRVQIVEYAAIAEALLRDMISHGIDRHHFSLSSHTYKDVKAQTGTIKWPSGIARIRKTVARRSFEWCIEVAASEGVVDQQLKQRLNTLRKHRNSVHLTKQVAQGTSFYLGLSKRAYVSLNMAVEQTQVWKATHP